MYPIFDLFNLFHILFISIVYTIYTLCKNITYTLYITYTEIRWRPPLYFRASRLYYDQKYTLD